MTNETKHTSGPWEVRNRLDIFNTRGTFIATALTHDARLLGPNHHPKATYLGSAEANAALIAAAPRTKTALEDLLVAVNDSLVKAEPKVIAAMQEARAAIEEATK